MHSAAACAIQKKITCPHRNFVTSGLPTQNRIQQNFGVGEAHPKNHDPGGQPTGFEDPCRTLGALHSPPSFSISGKVLRTPGDLLFLSWRMVVMVVGFE